jgi:uncharacterized protein (TIGR03437 family)
MGAAQPSISAVVNAASGNNQGLPNGGIAQGAIFLVTGSGMGPSTLAVDPNPFQDTMFGGTSVSVTVNNTTVSALMYYTSDGQLSALLPSNTPVGTGMMTVTYNGQASATAPLTVVANNPGIFTATSNGQGLAIVTYPDYSLVSAVPGADALACKGPKTYCGAAIPGDTLVLWATGLGPVSGNDAAGAGLGINMGSIPLTVWLGGVQAAISYQGRSGCCIGEDQIVFTVPSGVPTGCGVPLALQVGSIISNYTIMPVANAGRSCTPANTALASSAMQSIGGTTGSVSYGQISLRRQLAAANSNGLQYVDIGQGSFAQVAIGAKDQPLLLSYLDTQPLGTCLGFNSLTPSNPLQPTNTIGTNAGRITVTGPSGSQIMTERVGFGQPTQYSATFSQFGTYFSGGNYTVTGAGGPNAGTGGTDVGSFTTRFTISAAPSWPSTEQYSVNAGITRGNGVAINWTGGSSSYYVEIDGRAATDSSYTVGASFSCLVPSNAGTFTVPASALLGLPASVYGEIDFKPTLTPIPYTATGLDFGSVTFNYHTASFPPYQ